MFSFFLYALVYFTHTHVHTPHTYTQPLQHAPSHPHPPPYPQETDNPDLRDRAYIYWRLLSTTPEVAKDVVLSEKPVISSANDDLEPALLDDLIRYIGTLSSVYHKRPEQFVTRQRLAVTRADELETNHQFEDEGQVYAEEGGEGKAPVVAAPEVDLLGDLLDLGEPVAPVGVSPTQGGGQGNVLDLLGMRGGGGGFGEVDDDVLL